MVLICIQPLWPLTTHRPLPTRSAPFLLLIYRLKTVQPRVDEGSGCTDLVLRRVRKHGAMCFSRRELTRDARLTTPF